MQVQIAAAGMVSLATISMVIIGLDLSYSRLQGTIPPNSTLFHLNHLNLAFNDFNHSTISSEFGSLTSLTHLNLSNSNFQGNIPSKISHLSNLISLDLSWNLGCSMDPINFQTMLQNLTILRELLLSLVKISSKLTMNLSSTLTYLDLTFTGLFGNLPSNIFHLPNIETLLLSDNGELSGSLPEFNCSIHGDSMKLLDLAFTNLSGVLPDSIGCLKSLRRLRLRGNRISGAIPESIGDLTQLVTLDLSNNTLTGKFPITFSNLTNLELLSLSDNKLTGSIPNSIFTLKRLQYLSLSRNHFRGIEPTMYVDNTNRSNFSSPYLEILDLSSCGIEEFPDFLRNSQSLGYLDLSDNKIHGQIPSWFKSRTWDFLFYFSVSHNFLTDTIDQLAFTYLGGLDMSYNSLHGQLPSCICNLSNLHLLDLSYNNFFSEIPQYLGNSSRLSVLDLGNNGLFGIIPATFTEGTLLIFLILDNNQLEGPLPRSLANCTKLKLLDVGNNKIDDKFPIWLETLSRLEVLILKSNQFHGAIGNSKISNPFPQLRIIDVSCNELTGLLPQHLLSNYVAMTGLIHGKYLEPYMQLTFYRSYYAHSVSLVIKGVEYNFERLSTTRVVLDFSSNSFEGEIPELIGNLHSLQILNLSHNNLTGHIPRTFGNLNKLESLDLSWNQLDGTIPVELVKLTFLGFLNLSKNNFIGCIPRDRHFGTFGNDSYLGNSNLYGFPLSKDCGDPNTPPPSAHFGFEQESDSEFFDGFTWKVVLMGYGCGLVLGLVMGCLMFLTGKPRWFIDFIDQAYKIRKRSWKLIYMGT